MTDGDSQDEICHGCRHKVDVSPEWSSIDYCELHNCFCYNVKACYTWDIDLKKPVLEEADE